MKKSVLDVELRTLKLASYLSLIVGVYGVVTFLLSGASYILIDGLFSVINFISIYTANKIAHAQEQTRASYMYPAGKQGMESVYILFRSLLLIVLFGFSFLLSMREIIDYLVTGVGNSYDSTGLVSYTLIGFAFSMFIAQQMLYNNRKIKYKSELLKIELKAAVIDGLMTFAGGIALILVPFLPDNTILTSPGFDIRMILDSILVIIIVIVTIREPIQYLYNEVQRLTGKRIDVEVEKYISKELKRKVKRDSFSSEFKIMSVYAVKKGKSYELDVYVKYTGTKTARELDEFRDYIRRLIKEDYANSVVFVTFSDKMLVDHV